MWRHYPRYCLHIHRLVLIFNNHQAIFVRKFMMRTVGSPPAPWMGGCKRYWISPIIWYRVSRGYYMMDLYLRYFCCEIWGAPR